MGDCVYFGSLIIGCLLCLLMNNRFFGLIGILNWVMFLFVNCIVDGVILVGLDVVDVVRIKIRLLFVVVMVFVIVWLVWVMMICGVSVILSCVSCLCMVWWFLFEGILLEIMVLIKVVDCIIGVVSEIVVVVCVLVCLMVVFGML